MLWGSSMKKLLGKKISHLSLTVFMEYLHLHPMKLATLDT